MKLFILFLLTNGAAALCDCTRPISMSRSSRNKTYRQGDLIFQEEFNYFNRDLWHHEININGGYNNEFEIYDDYPQNVYVQDGKLYIKPSMSLDTAFGGNFEALYNGPLKLDGCTDPPGATCQRQAGYPYINPPVVSGRIRTFGSFSFTYGNVEIRAKMNSGDWMWPAIWMLPEDSKYGQWPRSGEIDIAEVRGNRNLVGSGGIQIGSEQSASTLHYGPAWNQNGFMHATGTKNTAPGNGFDRDFHLYQVQWNTEQMRFLIDNQEVKLVRPPNGGFFELGQFSPTIPTPWTKDNTNNLRMAPFDQNFHFILNVAVGGGYFPPGTTPAAPWGSQTPFLDFLNAQSKWKDTWQGDDAALIVDYIRVYAI